MLLLDLAGDALRTFIEENDVVLVDVTATWCNPCKQLAPILESVSKKIEGIAHIVTINSEKESAFCSQFLVRSVPTMIIFKNGDEAERINGIANEEEIIALLKSVAGEEKD